MRYHTLQCRQHKREGREEREGINCCEEEVGDQLKLLPMDTKQQHSFHARLKGENWLYLYVNMAHYGHFSSWPALEMESGSGDLAAVGGCLCSFLPHTAALPWAGVSGAVLPHWRLDSNPTCGRLQCS